MKKQQPKKESLEAMEDQLKEQVQLAEERLSQIKYLQADFENYRKALDKQRLELEQVANQRLVAELLPLIDDLEAAAEKAGSEAKEGYALMLKKLLSILEKAGLKPVESLGRRLDPHYHEALLTTESHEPEGTILQELLKGYTFHSRVIRHAKVEVAKNKKPEKENDSHVN